jgi:AcrR family transcriptional regulator
MKKSSNIKENIIEVTTELIRQSGGDINDITIRMIAEKANVGTGLINYHFQSKENLITLCVQRIIENVVMEFSPLDRHYQNDRERLTDWAIQVFDFLFENKAISRISILGDLLKLRGALCLPCAM